MAAFSAIFGGAIAVAGATGRLPRRPPLLDVALVGVAGHKVSRLIAKDKVASPLRAPFIRTVTDEDGDLVDEPTGVGMHRAVGQLLTCPKCVGQWACATFLVGTIYSPRADAGRGVGVRGRRDQRLPARGVPRGRRTR